MLLKDWLEKNTITMQWYLTTGDIDGSFEIEGDLQNGFSLSAAQLPCMTVEEIGQMADRLKQWCTDMESEITLTPPKT